MDDYKNVSVGKIILPDDTPILPNAVKAISDEMVKNEGVKGFIDDKLLVKQGSSKKEPSKKPAEKSEARKTLEAKATELGITFTDETTGVDIKSAIAAHEERVALIELALEAGVDGAADMSKEDLEAALADK